MRLHLVRRPNQKHCNRLLEIWIETRSHHRSTRTLMPCLRQMRVMAAVECPKARWLTPSQWRYLPFNWTMKMRMCLWSKCLQPLRAQMLLPMYLASSSVTMKIAMQLIVQKERRASSSLTSLHQRKKRKRRLLNLKKRARTRQTSINSSRTVALLINNS